jgi:hypothetical protein
LHHIRAEKFGAQLVHTSIWEILCVQEQQSIRARLTSITSVSKFIFHSFVDNPVEKAAQGYSKVKD